MIDVDEARLRVEQYLRSHYKHHDLVVVDRHTRHEDFGWVFFYNTRAYAERSEQNQALVGNAPLLVDRETGEIHVTGTALPTDRYIEQYRQKRTTKL